MLALFLILGGTATAAYTVGKNSVGTQQLKNGAVTSKKLSKEVKRQLAKAGIRGPQGIAGPAGATGATGLTGPQGSSANVTTYLRSDTTHEIGQDYLKVDCNEGDTAISGTASQQPTPLYDSNVGWMDYDYDPQADGAAGYKKSWIVRFDDNWAWPAAGRWVKLAVVCLKNN